jgi:hypothetical protein
LRLVIGELLLAECSGVEAGIVDAFVKRVVEVEVPFVESVIEVEVPSVESVFEVEVPSLSPFIARTPPTAPAFGASGLVELVAFLANAANSSRVLPVSGPLMTPTSPV